MPEKKEVVGHIVELIDETNLVEVEEPHGNDGWKKHTFPQEIFRGHFKLELGEHVAVEVRSYERFSVAEARALTAKENQWLKQRFARASAKLDKIIDNLDDEIFEPID